MAKMTEADPGASRSPSVDAGAQALALSFAAFPVLYQGDGLRGKQLGLELIPMWHAGSVAGGGLM